MTEQAQAIRAYMVGSFQQLPPSIIDDLSKANVSLLGIVRLMGDYLTSEDGSVRTRAVQFLAEVTCLFLDLSAQTLTQGATPISRVFTVQAVRTLTTFFADKISDAVTLADNFLRSKAPEVLPDTAPRAKKNEADAKTMQGSTMLVSCLKALTVLSTCHSSQEAQSGQQPPVKGFGMEQAHVTADALFNNVRTTDHPQSLRFIIYRLLDSLVAHHRNSLKAYKSSQAVVESKAEDSIDLDGDEPQSQVCQGKAFLKGYVHTVSGEKDPRNLMVLFGVEKVLLTEWQMDREMTEAFFDITFCYFPITFRPPPDDPYGITSDDLKLALRAAIVASPAMAPLGYPLLLEKLSAAGGPAKLDTLRTLIAAMPIYGRAAALANAKKLWEALKVEIFHATDDETCDLSCDTLTVLLYVLYDKVDPPEGIAPKMVYECLVELEEPGKSLAKAAIKVLACMVKATSATAYLAIYGFMDQMIKIFADPADLAMRTPILAGIGELLEVLAKVYRTSEKAKMKEISAAAESVEAETSSVLRMATSKSAAAETVGGKEGSGEMLPAQVVRRTYKGDNRPLDPFLADLLSSLSNGLRSTSYRRSALLAYSSVISISILSTATFEGPANAMEEPKPFLSPEETAFLTREVAELLTSTKGDEVREEALCAIEVVSTERVTGRPQGMVQTSKVIEDVVIPVLLQCLPNRLMPADDLETRTAGQLADEMDGYLDLCKNNIRRSLGAVSRLCVAPHLFDATVVKIVTKLELCCATFGKRSSIYGVDLSREEGKPQEAIDEQVRILEEANVGYARGLIMTLQTLLDEKKRRGHKDLAKYGQTLPPRLVRLVLGGIEAGVAAEERLGIGANTQVIADCASLMGTLVKAINMNKQRDLIVVLNKTFANGAVPVGSSGSGTSLIASSSPLANGRFQPFELESTSSRLESVQRDSLALFGAAAVACSKEVGVPTVSADASTLSYFAKLIRWTLASGSSELQAKTGMWMICSCVNKHVDDKAPELSLLLSSFWNKEVLPASSSSDWVRRRRAQQIWMWIARGFVVRASTQGQDVLSTVLSEIFDKSAVEDESDQAWQFAKQAARSIEIVAKTDDVVTKENGFTIRLLQRQRFFAFILPRVVEGYKSKSKTLYLIALASLLPFLPAQTISEQLGFLFPLLIQALDLPDPKARASAANSIMIAAEIGKKIREAKLREIKFDASSLIEEHLSTIIKRLLSNARVGSFAIPSTRIASLQTLSSLATSMPPQTLVQHRQTVLKALAADKVAIDDPKRVVRTYGVDCRDAWFAVPEREDE